MNSLLDRTDLVGRLFFPSDRTSPAPPGAEDRFVDVPGAGLHVRLHPAEAARGAVLLFHGNGENVCDWDEAARTFARHGARLLVVDYRGYGASTGVSTLRRVLDDAHVVLAAVRRWVPLPLVLMGRSLGSAPAWDVAQSAPDLSGVVIDSGFSDVDAFAVRRGLDPATLLPDDRFALDPLPKVAASRAPLLLLHGEVDRAIVIREAEAAAKASTVADTTLVRLPGRGHNDLYLHPDYWRSLGAFLGRVFV